MIKKNSVIIIILILILNACSEEKVTPDYNSEVYTQRIFLEEGWNYWSANLYTHDSVSHILEAIKSQHIITLDEDSNMYLPANNINTIGYYSIGKSYKTNVTDTCSFTLRGSRLIPELIPIRLDTGKLNYLGYLRTSPGETEYLLSSILDQLIILKNIEGEAYWPEYGINSIDSLRPGQGYSIMVTSKVYFTYPPNDFPY